MNQSMVLSQLCHITAGKDYEAGSFSLSFPASNQGETRCANITIIDDTIALEGNETFDLRLIPTPGSGISGSSGTVTIIDDDGERINNPCVWRL